MSFRYTRIVVRGGPENAPPLTTRVPIRAWLVAVYSARLRDLASAPAQRIELAQSFGLLAGGDLLGKQSAGHRAVRQSPHPVAAGDVDAA